MENKESNVISVQDINRIKYLVKDLPEKIGSASSLAGKQVVFVVGNTGAGKSTTVNYLTGCEIQQKQEALGPVATSIPMKDKKSAPVGSGLNSETLYPEIYSDENFPTIAYYDCPGFSDNRGLAEEVCASVGTQLAVRSVTQAASIALMVVIDIYQMRTERGESFKRLAKVLGDLLKSPDALNESVLFVFTKCPTGAADETKKMILTDIDELIKTPSIKIEDKKIFFLMKKNVDNIVLINVFDQGQGIPEIIQKLQKLKPLSKETFSFNKYAAHRQRFESTIFDIAAKGQMIMDGTNHLSKKQQFDKLSLSECKEKVPFYQTEISRFRNPLSIQNKDEQLAVFQKKIGDNKVPLERTTKRLEELAALKNGYNAILQEIDIKVPFLYKEHSIYDERWRWFGIGSVMNTATTRVFEFYPPIDIPYTCFRVEEWKNNGRFTANRTFANDGYYNTQYESERGKNGEAGFKIFINTCDKLDNRKKIDHTVELLRQGEAEETECQNKKLQLELENLAFQNAILSFTKETLNTETVTKQQIQNLESAERSNRQEFEELNRRIPDTDQCLQKLKLRFESYEFDSCEIYSMSSLSVPNKQDLDQFHRESVPMLISDGVSIWLYSLDNNYANTKLTKLLQVKLYEDIVFSDVSLITKVSTEIFEDLRRFALENGHAYFMNNRDLFETVGFIARCINYDCALLVGFLESLDLMRKNNLLRSSIILSNEAAEQESSGSVSESFLEYPIEDDNLKMENFECPIGYAVMSDPVVVSCGHSFERVNIAKHCNGCNTCPVCKQEINKTDFKSNINLKNSIAAMQKRETAKLHLLFAPLDEISQSAETTKDFEEKLEKKLEKLSKKIIQLTTRKDALFKACAEKKTLNTQDIAINNPVNILQESVDVSASSIEKFSIKTSSNQ